MLDNEQNESDMKSLFVFITAILMASCAKMEFDEIAESPFNGKVDPVCSTYRNFESDGWHIVSLYFLDKDSKRIKSKIRKSYFEDCWYSYELDSAGDYNMKSSVENPYLLIDSYKTEEIAATFTFGGDTIRIHRCGGYPKENPKFSLLVVIQKEANNPLDSTLINSTNKAAVL